MVKYPSPREAVENFNIGVETSKEKWAAKAKKGAPRYETWYAGFASVVYPIIAALPEKTADPVENWVNRGAPVVEAIKRLSKSYKAAKLEQISKTAKEAAARLGLVIG